MKTNYIFIGDSIVYGVGDYNCNGWTSMFKNYIIGLDIDSKICSNYVHIAAFPGATSKDILKRIDHILNAFTFDSTKNEVIISIGVNDTQIIDDKQKVDMSTYRENIIKIINSVRSHNSSLKILGLTRIRYDIPYELKSGKFFDNNIIEKYDETLEKICYEYGIEYIKMGDILQQNDFIDAVHPNNIGHQKIYNRFLLHTHKN